MLPHMILMGLQVVNEGVLLPQGFSKVESIEVKFHNGIQ